MYQIKFEKTASKEFKRLHPSIKDHIKEKIYNLMINPRPNGYIKLKGDERYRIRVGVYRIIYDIDDKNYLITISVIAHRNEAYDH